MLLKHVCVYAFLLFNIASQADILAGTMTITVQFMHMCAHMLLSEHVVTEEPGRSIYSSTVQG